MSFKQNTTRRTPQLEFVVEPPSAEQKRAASLVLAGIAEKTGDYVGLMTVLEALDLVPRAA